MLPERWFFLGTANKTRPYSGGEVCPVRCSVDKGGGSLQTRTSALFVAKKLGFFEIGGEPVRIRGEGSILC